MSGWMHFDQAEARRDPEIGARSLSVAVMPEGVTLVVTAEDEPPRGCTIGWADFDLLVHHVELERGNRG